MAAAGPFGLQFIHHHLNECQDIAALGSGVIQYGGADMSRRKEFVIFGAENAFIDIDKIPFCGLIGIALGDMDLPLVDDRGTGSLKWDDLILHKKYPAAFRAPAQFKFVVIMQIPCVGVHFAGGILRP